MSPTIVALVLSNTDEDTLRSIPSGTALWIASTPETESTLRAARRLGFSVTRLFPNGSSPEQWLVNYLDSVDQHHNELSQAQPYTELRVYGLAPFHGLEHLLREFGFVAWSTEPYGISASKSGPFAPAATLV